MKFLAIFGSVGLLCTFAIIAVMWGEQADIVTSNIGKAAKFAEGQGEQARGEKLEGVGTLPKPVGTDITLKSIYFPLLNYKIQYGDYPEGPGNPAISSNYILRELFAKGFCRAEKTFYVPGSLISTQRPDENSSGNSALSAGENHWAYVRGSGNIDSYGTVPVLIEPYRPGETKFRESDYGGKRQVFVLFSDGSVRQIPINSKGEPVIRKVNILSSEFAGWRGDAPTVYQPESY